MTKIAVFVGSLRKNSFNKILAHSFEKHAPEGVTFEYVSIDLPLYNEDIEAVGFPDSVQKVKQVVDTADAVLFFTPEYNRSVPGVLKNAIDWVSRPYGESSFSQKHVGIVGASVGPVGSALAQAELRHIMLFNNAKVMGQPEVYVANAYEVFSEKGVSERWSKNFEEYMSAFVSWVRNA